MSAKKLVKTCIKLLSMEFAKNLSFTENVSRVVLKRFRIVGTLLRLGSHGEKLSQSELLL